MPIRKPSLRVLVLASLVLAATAAAVGRLYVGDSPIWSEKFGLPAGGELRQYILQARLKLALMAVIVGAGLAGSGTALQALLRNPLAEPFILGLSSGAAVGVFAQRWLMSVAGMPPMPMHLGALVGGGVAAVVVYGASRSRAGLDPLGLLLTGVVLSMINGSLLMIIRHYLPLTQRDAAAAWVLGYLAEWIDPMTVLIAGVVIGGGLVWLWCVGRAMDAASFSDPEATSLGVNLGRLRTMLFVVASAMAAAAVVLAGPLAFVGLVCPHLARMLLGPGHRSLVIASAAMGALLLLAADTSSRLFDYGQGVMPLGVFTAAIGGPVFVWILRRHVRRGW